MQHLTIQITVTILIIVINLSVYYFKIPQKIIRLINKIFSPYWIFCAYFIKCYFTKLIFKRLNSDQKIRFYQLIYGVEWLKLRLECDGLKTLLMLLVLITGAIFIQNSALFMLLIFFLFVPIVVIVNRRDWVKIIIVERINFRDSAIADAKILPFTKPYRRIFINDYGTWFTFYDRDNLEEILPKVGTQGLGVSASGYIVHKSVNGVLTNKGTILEVVV